MVEVAKTDRKKTGILLINLGTPEATDYWSMRRYLRQFLSDKRVVEASGPVWWFIFNAIILTRRPKSSGHAYDQIWNHDRNESPLKTITRLQAENLAGKYANQPDVIVDWAMRYGKPAIAEGIERLHQQGVERVLLFPLYPQYSSATTGTAMDSVFDALRSLRHQPAVRSVPPYFDHPAHISALAHSIRDHHASLPWTPELTIASLHGLPVEFIKKGDPYQDHCEATVALLRAELGLKDWQLLLTYQSRSGRAQWLTPDTEDTLIRLASDGIKDLTIIAPGFAADCVETLEELQIRAVEKFKSAGGRNCSIIPCLNDSKLSICMLKSLVDSQLLGWA